MTEFNNLKNMGPIDMDAVLERVGGDESFLQELIDIYVDDFIEKYSQLEQAIERGDFENIRELGHSLKGSSGNLSLTDLHGTAFGIETSGKDNDIEQARFLFARLKEEFKRFKDFLPPEKRQNIEQKMPSLK